MKYIEEIMSEDKRKVHTDALETLGMIIDETAKRDAIHLAVEPVIAKEILIAGEHVTIDGRQCNNRDDSKAVGIIDPFLDRPVLPGERFWLVVYPRQITSLRHVWEHPKFPPSEFQIDEGEMTEVERSKKWIKDLINGYREEIEGSSYYYMDNYEEYLTYECVMDHADYWVMSEDNYPRGYDLGNFETLLPYEFWHHYEIVRGKKVEEVKKRNFFSCSC